MNSASSVLVLGALSDIGRAIAREYAKSGRAVILAARDAKRLQPDVDDLILRYRVSVRAVEFDILDTNAHSAFVDNLGTLPVTVICVVGLLGDQSHAQAHFTEADLIMRTNYTGAVSILGEVANRMASAGGGCVIGISSVAGDRGRAVNYFYGSAKAGFTAFLSGLRQRLVHDNVRVITVKPGFVRTRMTAHMSLPSILTAQPEEVAQAIVNAERMQSDIIYVRRIWRYIMLVIDLIPEFVFKKLRF